MPTQEFDVLCIGGGSGLTAAWYAGRDGLSVALVERDANAMGGTCVNRGCIPTKGLIQAADVMETLRQAAAFGIHVPMDQVKVDYARLVDTVLGRREKEADGTRRHADDAYTTFYGRARFVAPRTVELEDGRRVRGRSVFICTGARPTIPAIPGLAGSGFWTNVDAIETRVLPKRLAILGAGYIGTEFGHHFSSLGSVVTVIGRSGVLAREDPDIRAVFREAFAQRVRLLDAHTVARVEKRGGVFVLHVKGPDGPLLAEADALLVATGRTPNTEDLGLDATGVRTREGGWIEVDGHLRTGDPDVYAYGDVIGQAMFKHTSSHEGELAYRNSQGASLRIDYAANPHAVFSSPQIGSVGLTEPEARARGLDVAVGKVEYAGIAKGRILGAPPGLAKAIVDKATDKILGFHIVGPHAADLVAEVVVAMTAGEGKAEHVRQAIHVHPTLPELVKAAFDRAA